MYTLSLWTPFCGQWTLILNPCGHFSVDSSFQWTIITKIFLWAVGCCGHNMVRPSVESNRALRVCIYTAFIVNHRPSNITEHTMYSRPMYQIGCPRSLIYRNMPNRNTLWLKRGGYLFYLCTYAFMHMTMRWVKKVLIQVTWHEWNIMSRWVFILDEWFEKKKSHLMSYPLLRSHAVETLWSAPLRRLKNPVWIHLLYELFAEHFFKCPQCCPLKIYLKRNCSASHHLLYPPNIWCLVSRWLVSI